MPEYLVIGQGLAGSALALKLLTRNRSFLVVDAGANNTSSRIAAGLYNPITGKLLTKTWNADQLFPQLTTFYQHAEKITRQNFLVQAPIYRPFLSHSEVNDWTGKSSYPEYEPYIQEIKTSSAYPYLKDPIGGIVLRQTGHLQTNAYIEAVRTLLIEHQKFRAVTIEYSQLKVDAEGVEYNGERFGKVIFCPGAELPPWFNWLPIKPLKGQTLTIELGLEPSPAEVINRGIYLVPQTEGNYRLGATYEHSTEPGITESGKEELLGRFGELFYPSPKVIRQDWGFRPTTPDRRPIIGTHPAFKSMAIVTGLGTKGVSLAPFCAEELLNSLENGIPVNKMVDIERYKVLYSGSPS